MTYEEAYQILAEVEYKPEYAFRLTRYDDRGQVTLTLCTPLIVNQEHPTERMTFTIDWQIILTGLNPEGFFKQIRNLTHWWEQHEADEWLTYRGSHVFEPHPNPKHSPSSV